MCTKLSDEHVSHFVNGFKRNDVNGLDSVAQLHNELHSGHVFNGWREGVIGFPPTYKYEMNFDRYVGENPKEGEKKRSPAW